jgi:signal transduction histidine kinase
VIELPLTMLETWPDRWRYPDLVLALVSGDQATVEAAFPAVLRGLAVPMETPAHAIRWLIDQGEFVAADYLRTAGLTLSEKINGYDELTSLLKRERQAAVAEIGRISHRLSARARRSDGPERDHDQLLDLAHRSRSAATAAIAAWNEEVDAAENAWKDRLLRELQAKAGDANTAWTAAVIASVDAGELPTAQRLLSGDPEDHASAPAGPVAVPRPPDAWPWAQTPVGIALTWYTGARAPVGFEARWLPSGDEDAEALVAALDRLRSELTRPSVEAFANALDRLLGVPALTGHRADPVGGGFLTFLHGISDAGLPRLALPREMPLWVGPEAWRPPATASLPAVWLVRDVPRPPSVSGVAILDPTNLFRLVVPRSDDRAHLATARRVNLLRMVCEQLRLEDVIGRSKGLDFGGQGITAAAVGWIFDLLGVGTAEATVEVLLYDTGDHPVALRTALDALVPDGRRPARLTHASVAAWRDDPAAMQLLRDRLLGRKSVPARVRAAMAAVLTEWGQEQDFEAADVGAAFELLADAKVDDELLNLDLALRGAAGAGLIQKVAPTQYRQGPPGLMALLNGGPDELRTLACQALEDLRRLLDEVRTSFSTPADEAPRQDDPLFSATEHFVRNDAFVTRTAIDAVLRRSPELNPQARAVLERLAARQREKRTYSIEIGREALQLGKVDLLQLLADLRTWIDVDHEHVSVELENECGNVVLYANEVLLRGALNNLIINAVEAIQSVKERGRIGIRTSLADEASPDSQVVVDVEDDGPGVSEESMSDLFMAGRGLGLARRLLEYGGGSLDYLGASARLAGAHFQACVPVYQASEA